MSDLKRVNGWFLAAAEIEASTPIAIGAASVAADARFTGRGETEWFALARLIELRRRQRGLSVEDLALRADVDLEDVVSIEQGGGRVPEPRTIHQMARALDLPERGLLGLAGLIEASDRRFREATVRFAARSEPVELPRPEQLAALDEYVKILAEPAGMAR
jgi:transcriptional regulator with XRE-family HTH domain